MSAKNNNGEIKGQPLSRGARRKKRERIFVVATIILIMGAWLYGYFTAGIDVTPLVAEILPEAEYIEKQGELFIGYNQARTEIVGFAATAGAPGYSGPIEVLVGVDAAGTVTGVKIVEQRETPGFFRLVTNAGILPQFVDREFNAPFQIGEDIDAVSGATLSAEGVARATRLAIRQIAEGGLAQPIPPEKQSFKFGGPDIALLLLFTTGYFGHRMRGGVWKKRIRWGTLLSGMLILGFVYTAPLTITMITSFLGGYWPDWHNNLYWYLLVGGILFVTLVDGKNPYCGWFCPFGTVQECLGTLTGAKLYRPKNLHELLNWLQRGLAVFAIVLGLVLRRPGVAGYEPFATLFDFHGTGLEWLFLALILIASLLIYRPFCNYLCPIDPTVDMIAAMRKWVREVWRTWRRKKL